MKRKVAMFVAGLLWGCCTMGQQTLIFDSGVLVDSALQTAPYREVANAETGIEVTYDFTSAVIMEDDLFPGRYLWKIDGFGMNGIAGTPSTLLRVDKFGIPEGKECQIEIVEAVHKDFEYALSPARPPLVDNGKGTYTKENVKPIDPMIAVYPGNIVEIEGGQKYRGRGILHVKISPIQYNASTGKTRVFTHVKYAVRFVDNPVKIRAYEAGETQIPSISEDDNFLSNTVLNVTEPKKQKALALSWLRRQDYLIVSVPKYASAVQQLADWKKLMGYNVHIVTKSNWTTATVKSEVQKFYDANPDFYFLLIMGDYEDVPAISFLHSYNSVLYSYVTDVPYVCMDGEDDEVPDVYMGRLSVSTAAEADVVVNKIINYEKDPVTAASFYQKGVHCAYFQDGQIYDNQRDGKEDHRFVRTSEDVRNYMLRKGKTISRIYFTDNGANPKQWNDGIYAKGEPIPADLQKPWYAWDGNSNHVLQAVNDGTFYVLYRGHGEYFEWSAAPGMLVVSPSQGNMENKSFLSQSNIESLSNGNKLPVIFSITCLTGQFNGKTCFAETFLRKSNGGCVAIYGATEKSFSGYNDVLIGGMFDAIWPEPGLIINMQNTSIRGVKQTPTPTYQLGQILNQGMERMSEIYGTQDVLGRYNRKVFHCFGDPSMRIYTQAPTAFSDVSIIRETSRITVSVSAEEQTTITFYNSLNGEVVSYVGSTAGYEASMPQYVTVCISGHNKIPYIQSGINPSDLYIQNKTVKGTNVKPGIISGGERLFRIWSLYWANPNPDDVDTWMGAGTDQYFLGKDTVIGNHTYMEVYWRKDCDAKNDASVGYAFREDSVRTYVYDYADRKEYVLFDFSLKEGDVLTMNWGDVRTNPVFQVLEVGDTVLSFGSTAYLKVYDKINKEEDMWLSRFGSARHGIAWRKPGYKKEEHLLCVDGWGPGRKYHCYFGERTYEDVSGKGKLMLTATPALTFPAQDCCDTALAVQMEDGRVHILSDEYTWEESESYGWAVDGNPLRIQGVNYVEGDSVEVEGLVHHFYSLDGYPCTEMRVKNIRKLSGVSVEARQKSELTITPNPANEAITLTTMGCNLQKVEILDVNGRMLYAANVNNLTSFRYNVSWMPLGIYLARVKTSCGVLTKKFSVR